MRDTPPTLYVSDDPLYAAFNCEQDSCPEKLLMVGLLSRAIMDLTAVGPNLPDRSKAIKWFLSKNKRHIFSWHQIQLHISIPAKLRKHINVTLQTAIDAEREYRNAAKQPQGEESGESPGELDERSRHPFCQEVSAVLW